MDYTNNDIIKIDDEVSLSVYNDKISINIKGTNKLAFVNYTEELLEIIKNARFRVPQTEEKIKEYKYIYSNEYKKTLHQIVIDYYFGENARKNFYEHDYIIEHLDNNGFNCDISNLYFLKKIKNTYKGWNFDKEVVRTMPIIALRIYHIIENRTFQIAIVFNQSFVGETSRKILDTIRLLYNYNYEIVLQDAEQILETTVNSDCINLSDWEKLYRYNDVEINYASEIKLTEEEKEQGCGSIIFREGKAYFLIGQSGDSIGLMKSIPYKSNWNLK